MEQVWISLGSNLGERLQRLQQATEALARVGQILAVSDAYESEPVGYLDQPWFLNAVVGLQVGEENSPERLLQSLLAIEREIGRVRGGPGEEIPKGPRAMDLDILLYGGRVVDSATLRIPHPEMHRRRFVLEPLAQVAPALVHPVLGRSVQQLLQALPADEQRVRRFAALGWPRP
jgi:2-amino-4-hydroxy-6-hydroxymethyldihydropteridine diphosphokinase